jgi:hypothetical protein
MRIWNRSGRVEAQQHQCCESGAIAIGAAGCSGQWRKGCGVWCGQWKVSVSERTGQLMQAD